MSFETLAEDGQRLGKSHIVWQVVPGHRQHSYSVFFKITMSIVK